MSFDELNEQLKEYAEFRNDQRTANAVESLQKAQSAYAKLPMCPYCGGRIQVGYELCQHCRNPLAWVNGHACKPGQQDALRAKLEKDAKAQAVSERKFTFGCLQSIAIVAGTICIICLLGFIINISSANPNENDNGAKSALGLTGMTCLIVTIICTTTALSVRDEIRMNTPEYRSAMEHKMRIENEKKWAKNRSDREREESKKESEKLFASAEKHLELGNVPLACEVLSKLVLLYPNSSNGQKAKKIYEREKDADESQKEAKELYRKKEFEKAIALLVHVEKNYPETQGGIRAKNMLDVESQASELYSKALKLNTSNKKASMLKILNELVTRFPKTQFGQAAKQYLDNQSKVPIVSKLMKSNENSDLNSLPLVKCKHCKAVCRMVERKPNQILRCPKCKNTIHSE